eukprot:NODE_79_length_23048_cov_0.747614.p19 type:complete len:103 gc:universal NODE_79_length_23048_cov_0.747614:15976-16284(+)
MDLSRLNSMTDFFILIAAFIALSSGSGSSSIKPKPHMIQSPINLSIIPLNSKATLTILSKKPFRSSNISAGDMVSDSVVNPLISANNIVPIFNSPPLLNGLF